MTTFITLLTLARKGTLPATAAADAMISLQDALQTADRAVLAYYGRAHPLGTTNLPHELYEVHSCHAPRSSLHGTILLHDLSDPKQIADEWTSVLYCTPRSILR